MSKVTSFRIDDARLERLREAAELRGCSVSAIIREGAVREAFATLGRRELEAELDDEALPLERHRESG